MNTTATSAPPILAVIGQDTFRRQEAVEQLLARIEASGRGPVAPSRFAGNEASLADVLDEARTYSLLGELRVVIVEDADPFITRHRAALERYCAAPADSGVLVLMPQSLPTNTRLHKIIAQHGTIVKCEPLKGKAIGTWITQRAREHHGKPIEPRAAWLLQELAGSTLAALDAELGKLALYADHRSSISVDDVETLVGRQRQEDIFRIIDAMNAGDARGALQRWERIVESDRSAPMRAVGALAWSLRRLIDIKEQADSGTPLPVLARQAFCRPDELQQRLARLHSADLHAQLGDLLDVDVASKTGLSSPPYALERYIVTHSLRGARLRRPA